MSELFLQIFPNGASDFQLDQLRDKIFEIHGNPYLDRSKQWPDVIKRLDRIKSSIDMIESCYCYHSMRRWHEHHYNNYLKDYMEIGGTKEDFDECVRIQLKHLDETAEINVGVCRDSEGCSYNSMLSADAEAHFECLVLN